MLFDLLAWWYLKGWVQAWHEIPETLYKVQQAFTLPVLFRTLFSPWKQITSSGGRSLDEKIRSMIDNLLSRAVGFFVRFFVLLAALFTLATVTVFTVMLAVVWPAIPAAIVFFIIRGIAG